MNLQRMTQLQKGLIFGIGAAALIVVGGFSLFKVITTDQKNRAYDFAPAEISSSTIPTTRAEFQDNSGSTSTTTTTSESSISVTPPPPVIPTVPVTPAIPSSKQLCTKSDSVGINYEAEVHVVATLNPKNPSGGVDVLICNRGVPITLVLSSKETATWNLWKEPGAQVANVVLVGWGDQKIGSPATSNRFSGGERVFFGAEKPPVIEFSKGDDPNAKGYSSLYVRALDQINGVALWIQNRTGIIPESLTSFQNILAGDFFVVDGTNKFEPSLEKFTTTLIPSRNIQLSILDQREVPFSDDAVAVRPGDFTVVSGYSSRAIKNGKWYFEAELDVPSGESPDAFTNIGIFSLGLLGDGIIRFDIPVAPFGSPISALDFRNFGFAYPVIDRGIGLTQERSYIIPNDEMKDGDIIGLAIDADTGTLKISHNGIWDFGSYNTKSILNQNDGLEYLVGFLVADQDESGTISSDKWLVNFGSKPFTNSIPAGFKALKDIPQ